MKEMFEDLEKILSRELEVHSALVETANEFNKSIRENNISNIQIFTAKHDEEICKVEKLEEQRIVFCSAIGKALGLPSEKPKLSTLIEKAPPEQKSRLLKVQKFLKEKIDELSKLTISNRILLEDGLNVINHTFSFFQQSQKKYTPYGSKKKGTTSFQGYNLINQTV